MTEPSQKLQVLAEEAGSRLDQFLARRLPGASRGEARRLLEGGHVRVDGSRPRKGQLLAAGSEVVVAGYEPPGSWSPSPEPDLRVEVLYEDEDLVAVDKPAGVPSHPLRPGERGTAAGAVLRLYPELASIGPDRREAGLVHRLDTGTSGVLVFARTEAARESLVRQVRGGTARKRYRALVEGDASGLERVSVPLATAGARVVAVPLGTPPRRGQKALRAVTLVEQLERLGPFSLVSATIHAGRRHQIRAHLACSGHPVAGDRLYGASLPVELDRPFLHALEIRLESPSTGKTIKVRAKLAPDLEAVLGRLRSEAR